MGATRFQLPHNIRYEAHKTEISQTTEYRPMRCSGTLRKALSPLHSWGYSIRTQTHRASCGISAHRTSTLRIPLSHHGPLHPRVPYVPILAREVRSNPWGYVL